MTGADSGEPRTAAPSPEARTSGEKAARRPRQAAALLGLLCIPFLLFGLWEAWHDAPTNDEGFYLASGVTAWTRHDLRLNTEHPPLPKLLAALPVLLAQPEIPDGGGSWRTASPEYEKRFMAANDRAGKIRRIVFLSRLVPLLEGMLVGLGIYLLGAMLFGRRAGLLGAALWFTTAPPLAFSHINGLDVPMALFAVGISLALVRHVRAPSRGTTVLVGVVLGLGLLTRWTALALAPVVLVVATFATCSSGRTRLLRAGLVALVAWMTLWAGYRLVAPRSSPVPNGTVRVFGVDPDSYSDPVSVAVRVVPLPSEFRDGYFAQIRLDELRPSGAFILGTYLDRSVWWFWPATVLVKLPYTAIALALAAPMGWLRLSRPRLKIALWTLALPFGTLLAATMIQAPQFVGIRYLMPAIALGMVAIGPVALLVTRRAFAVAFALVAAVHLALFVDSVPGSIAWTNPGFRPGYRFAADSNFDIGQDYYELLDWSRGRDAWIAIGRIPVETDKAIDPFLPPSRRQMSGEIAVNASTLTVYLHDRLSWLRAYCPVQILGETILVYRIEGEPIAGRGPDAPAKPCPGPVSRRVASAARAARR